MKIDYSCFKYTKKQIIYINIKFLFEYLNALLIERVVFKINKSTNGIYYFEEKHSKEVSLFIKKTRKSNIKSITIYKNENKYYGEKLYDIYLTLDEDTYLRTNGWDEKNKDIIKHYQHYFDGKNDYTYFINNFIEIDYKLFKVKISSYKDYRDILNMGYEKIEKHSVYAFNRIKEIEYKDGTITKF